MPEEDIDDYEHASRSKLKGRLEKEWRRVKKRIRTKEEEKEERFRYNYEKNKAAVYQDDAV